VPTGSLTAPIDATIDSLRLGVRGFLEQSVSSQRQAGLLAQAASKARAELDEIANLLVEVMQAVDGADGPQ
jgi:hypothetical protein